MIELLKICDVSGKAVKKFTGNRKYIATGDIVENEIISFENVSFVTKPSRANQDVEVGNVIFAKMQNTLKVLQIDDYNCDNIYSTGFFVLKPKESVISDFLYWFLQSKNFNMQKDKQCKGATQKAISLEGLSKIKLINLPSKVEQGHITDKLQRVSALIELKKKQLLQLEQLIKSQFVEMFGDISLNSKGFKIVKLSDIAEYWNGLTYKPQDVSKDGIIVLRSSNIQKGQLDFEDVVRVSGKINERKFVRKNDILMCSRNGSARLVGKTALIKDSNEKMSFGAFMMIIRSEYYDYLNVYFKTDSFRNQISTGATTTINQITSNMMNKIKLPLPEFELIGQFADFVKLIDKYKFEIEKSLKETEDLLESLMTKYFG